MSKEKGQLTLNTNATATVNSAVVGTTSSTASTGGTVSYTELASGLRLGGVWKDLYDNCLLATATRDNALKELDRLRTENSELNIKMDRLNSEHMTNLGSLTKHKTSNWQLENILEAIREEKSTIESKCCAYETQIKWLDKQREQQHNENMTKGKELESLLEKNISLEKELKLSEERNKDLQFQLQEKFQILEFKDKRLESFEKINGVLHKSLKIKEKQLCDQVKNVQLLSETISELKQSILPKYRNMVFLKVNQNGTLKAKTPSFTPVKYNAQFEGGISTQSSDASPSESDNGISADANDTDDELSTPLKARENHLDVRTKLFPDEDAENVENAENSDVARLKNLLLLARLECKAAKEELEFIKCTSSYTGCVKGALMKQRAKFSAATTTESLSLLTPQKVLPSPSSLSTAVVHSYPSTPSNYISTSISTPVSRKSSLSSPSPSTNIPMRSSGSEFKGTSTTPKGVKSHLGSQTMTNIPTRKL